MYGETEDYSNEALSKGAGEREKLLTSSPKVNLALHLMLARQYKHNMQ